MSVKCTETRYKILHIHRFNKRREDSDETISPLNTSQMTPFG